MPTLERTWPELGRLWTVPNVLSLTRLVLIAPITYLIWIDSYLGWLFALITFAILTDWFDGKVARWSHSVSEWGKVLDPVADKAAAISTISALTFRTAEPTLPLWFFGLVIGRDVCILAGSIVLARRTGRVAMSMWLGKAAVAWLSITVLAAILKADTPVLQVCMWITAVLMVASFMLYLARFFLSLYAGAEPDAATVSVEGVLPDAMTPDSKPEPPSSGHSDERATAGGQDGAQDEATGPAGEEDRTDETAAEARETSEPSSPTQRRSADAVR